MQEREQSSIDNNNFDDLVVYQYLILKIKKLRIY